MDAYLTCWNPVPPDAVLGGSHHCDGNTTLDIATCTEVGLAPLCGEAAVQAFQLGLRLDTHKAVY